MFTDRDMASAIARARDRRSVIAAFSELSEDDRASVFWELAITFGFAGSLAQPQTLAVPAPIFHVREHARGPGAPPRVRTKVLAALTAQPGASLGTLAKVVYGVANYSTNNRITSILHKLKRMGAVTRSATGWEVIAVTAAEPAPESDTPWFHGQRSPGSDLTKRQATALAFIVESNKSRGFPPTLKEIGEHMGIRSTNGVSDHLRALQRKGMIVCDFQTARGIRVLSEVA